MFNCKHTKPDGVTGQQATELQIKIFIALGWAWRALFCVTHSNYKEKTRLSKACFSTFPSHTRMLHWNIFKEILHPAVSLYSSLPQNCCYGNSLAVFLLLWIYAEDSYTSHCTDNSLELFKVSPWTAKPYTLCILKARNLAEIAREKGLEWTLLRSGLSQTYIQISAEADTPNSTWNLEK